MLTLDEKRKEILDTAGHLLIEGGPGCGKTTIALLKASKAIAHLEDEQCVLFLSFSRAAVRQISDRMQGLLTSTDRNRLEVRTFHSFFLELVRAHGPLMTGTPSSFIVPDREHQLRADFDGDWKQETRRLARVQGRYVFDRLAETAAAVLATHRAVREIYSDTYPLIIVDEFQDTNNDQWEAVRALSETSTIICLADGDQRIYDFIDGVDEARIDQAVEHLKPTSFDLSKDNHRSPTSGLLDYANAVLRNDASVLPPKNLITWNYRWPNQCEAFAHLAIDRLQKHFEPQLGRMPTIALLTTTNQFAAQLSESLADEKAHPQDQGKRLLPIEHELNWDANLSAAAGYVVASILEWPDQLREHAIVATLNAIADFYRIKLAGGTAGARGTITTIEKAVTAYQAGKTVKSKTAQIIAGSFDADLNFSGDPVQDWQVARNRLHGAKELEEIFGKARLLRLFKATDALAWALIDQWNGRDAYGDAVGTVRHVLANETLDAAQMESLPVTLMNMHKSKGKEFDAVIIVEGQYSAPLLNPAWDAKKEQAARRVLRVAITRARHGVILVRPVGCAPLTSRA
ncbi:UvrD-helicase domain-containing protein [Kineosporia babensis]|uniref:ATP-dependent helicase n=1 Tax=Kineosporia babensis TaxID=499548 RepID=A0A9X1SXS8_9ACTN|nr:ATP-dependent helicase [Kineosporia babensis]MCD5316149.1 ATP-dependent helicase [Kineosporia babensis]